MHRLRPSSGRRLGGAALRGRVLHGALRFGEERGIRGELSCAEVLSPEWGTAPRVYYLHKPKRFVCRDGGGQRGRRGGRGSTVTLQRAEDDATVATARTDEFGDVWLEGLEPGRYRMWVQKEGYLDLPYAFDLTEKDQAVPEMRFYRKPATA